MNLTWLMGFIGFFNEDFIYWSIRKGWHSSLNVRDFEIIPRSSGPDGVGVGCSFKIENKLRTKINITSTALFFNGERVVSLYWHGSGPSVLDAKEVKPYSFGTLALFPKNDKPQEFKIIISDSFGRNYSADFTLTRTSL